MGDLRLDKQKDKTSGCGKQSNKRTMGAMVTTPVCIRSSTESLSIDYGGRTKGG